MKLLSLFSGIGAFEKALKNIGIDFELIGFSEIDKHAIKSYCAIHNVDESLNLGDITKINISNLPKNIDIITHGSPCQDFSIAGKQAGGDLGTGTRSSLMWNTINIVTFCKPKYVIWENVKNLLSKKHRHNFDSYLSIMESLGYNNYYQVLNSKDYGIPQNRERIYTISIRKDVDKGIFNFPEKEELKLRLKDVLEDEEDEVDEKYYLIDEKLKNYTRNFGSKGKLQEDICDTFQAAMGCGGGNIPLIKTDKCIQVGKLDIKGIDQIKRFYSIEGICPTLTSMQGGNREPKVVVRTPLKFLNRNKKNIEGDYAFCVDGCNTGGIKEITNESIKVRKLTPLECWRLMGFNDEDFKKAKEIGNSNTQLYKQAGNSIVVNVLEKIFKNLFKEEK